MTEITDEWATKLWCEAWAKGTTYDGIAAATLIKARVSALMAERDAEIARLREALDEAVDVFAGMCDDEIEEELLPRLRHALGATHEQG